MNRSIIIQWIIVKGHHLQSEKASHKTKLSTKSEKHKVSKKSTAKDEKKTASTKAKSESKSKAAASTKSTDKSEEKESGRTESGSANNTAGNPSVQESATAAGEDITEGVEFDISPSREISGEEGPGEKKKIESDEDETESEEDEIPEELEKAEEIAEQGRTVESGKYGSENSTKTESGGKKGGTAGKLPTTGDEGKAIMPFVFTAEIAAVVLIFTLMHKGRFKKGENS